MKLLIHLILIFSVNTLQAQPNHSEEKKIDSLFAKYNAQTPGVSLAIVKDGKVVIKKGYGMANLEYDVPNSPQTIFHVASLSKQFTTFAIYLLEKEGKIKFNDDVRKYIPELPIYEKTITVNHLCSHTSGLKDQWALLTLAGWRMDDVITTEQILKLICRQTTLNFSPGTQFQYSNTGFTLLAEIIRRVSGKSFAEFTKEKIFLPLKMNHTHFYENNNWVVKNRAYSYGLESGVYEKRNLNYSTSGPTSLFTTVEDLAKWVLNFEDPIVGDVELINSYNQISKLENGEPAVLAVVDGETIYHLHGQFKRNYKGLEVFNHTGSDAGFKSYMGRFFDNRISIILLSNDEQFASYKAGMDIAEFYLSEKFKPRENPDEVIRKLEVKPDMISNQNLKEFEGEYLNDELASKFLLKVSSGQLTMIHNRLSDIVLREVEKDKFAGKISFNVQVNFVRNNKGKVISLNITNFGATNVMFKKV